MAGSASCGLELPKLPAAPTTTSLLGGEGERVDGVGLGAVGAEGEVEDADVQAVVGAVLDRPLDAGDHLGDVAVALGVGHLDAHDPRVRGHAHEVLAVPRVGAGRRGGVAAADDPGHVGAVAEAVEAAEVRVERVQREVGPDDHLPRSGEAVDRRHPGVDQGDVDALAGVAALPERLGAGLEGGRVQGSRVGGGVEGAAGELDGRVGRDRDHPGEGGQSPEPALRDPGGDAVDDRQLDADLATEGADLLLDRAEAGAGLDPDDDRLAGAGRGDDRGHHADARRERKGQSKKDDHGPGPAPSPASARANGAGASCCFHQISQGCQIFGLRRLSLTARTVSIDS